MVDALRQFDAGGLMDKLNLWLVLALGLCALLQAVRVVKAPKPAAAGGRLAALWHKTGPRAEVALVLLLTLLAGALRLYRIGSTPMGFNPDEASIAYDALCMANYGTDRYGYAMPAYLTAWGDGQNALYMYLLVPLYKLFGFSVFITRLPQAVIGTLVIPCLYLLLRKLAGDRLVAVAGAALFAVSPWHIMASRWALEPYPLAFTLLAGLACFVYAEKRPWLVMPAFAFWALSLYCYISVALFLLVFLALALLYWLRHKKITWRWLLPGAAVGLLLAAPLLLFVLVNSGILPEIRTPVLSVPLMRSFRAGEIGSDIYGNARAVVDFFVWQRPTRANNLYDHLSAFGVVYLFSAPFAVAGLWGLMCRGVAAAREKRFAPGLLWLLWLAAAVFMALLVAPSTLNRCIPLDMIYIVLAAYGLAAGARRLAIVRWAAVPVYAGALCLFGLAYFLNQAPAIGQTYNDSIMQAYAFADEIADGREILVPNNIATQGAGSTYPYIALNRGLAPRQFMALYSPAAEDDTYGWHLRFGNYTLVYHAFETVAPYGTDKVYVMHNGGDAVWDYQAMGFELEIFRNYTVAWWP